MAAPSTVPLASFESGDPDGVPLVLLHGFPLDHTMWQLQMDAGLPARVIAPDLRGFGSSYFDTPGSMDDMADDVLRLMDSMDVQRFVLCGLSMGGYIALRVAHKAPDRLLGLVLADSRAEADSAEARKKRDANIKLVESVGVQALADPLLPVYFSEEARREQPRLVEDVRHTLSAQSPGGVVNALRAMRDRPDSSGVLQTLRCPALVLVGERDSLTTPDMAERIAHGIPGAKLVTIPGAGHLSNLENPRAFNEALRTFLTGLAREGGSGRERPAGTRQGA